MTRLRPELQALISLLAIFGVVVVWQVTDSYGWTLTAITLMALLVGEFHSRVDQ